MEGTKIVGRVPLRLFVDEDGNPKPALVLRNAVGDGTLGNGDAFDVGVHTGNGSIIVNVNDKPHVYVVSMREALDHVDRVHRDHFADVEPPRTPKQLVELRAEGVRWAKEDNDVTIDAFTCDDCTSAAVCPLAFDPLNTDGYCLAEK